MRRSARPWRSISLMRNSRKHSKRNSNSGNRKEAIVVMNDESIISTRDLTRFFGGRPAVECLNLDVPRGSVFAFLGRNGSGKTTTIRMLLGLTEPTRGVCTVLGENSRQITPELRARIGYMSESHSLYKWMTVRQCGEYQRQFYPRWNERI